MSMPLEGEGPERPAPSGARGSTLRRAVETDAPAIAAIWNEGIEDGVATFRTRLRDPKDIASWLAGPHPVLVACDLADGHVLGFAGASAYRANRDFYAGIAEFSVYVARSARGGGVGTAVLAALIDATEAAGYWKLLSRVFVENARSRRLMARLGFREVGIYRRHARLDGHWRDVVIVERLLGDAAMD